MSRRRAAPRRAAGTRARAPQEEARALRAVAAVLGGLGLLGAVALGPAALETLRVRLRAEPFLLERVAARGLDRLPAETVAGVLALGAGVPLVDLDPAGLEARLAAHPWIARATAVRWPPDTLLVRIHEREALAVTRAGAPPLLHAVDASGTAFAPAGPGDAARLVEIVLDAPPAVGEADARLVEALALAASLRAHGLAVPDRVTLGLPGHAAGAELRLRGLAPAVRLARAEPGDALRRLAGLLAAGLPATVRAEHIDLRFAGRAVLSDGGG